METENIYHGFNIKGFLMKNLLGKEIILSTLVFSNVNYIQLKIDLFFFNNFLMKVKVKLQI